MKFVLSEKTANALRSVAAKEGIDPDHLVLLWCVAAGYEVEDGR
jgi:hypothetical protein